MSEVGGSRGTSVFSDDESMSTSATAEPAVFRHPKRISRHSLSDTSDGECVTPQPGRLSTPGASGSERMAPSTTEKQSF